MSRFPLILALVILALLSSACQPTVRAQGQRSLTATYQGTTLSTALPPAVRVPAAIAAAEETLRARGYSVSRVEATEERGRITGRPPHTSDFPRVVISAIRQPSGTRLDIRWDPFGDEEACRSILDGILQRLGL